MTSKLLTDLPVELFYNILSFIESPNQIAPFVCHSVSLISKSVNTYSQQDSLWEIILGGYHQNRPTNTGKRKKGHDTIHVQTGNQRRDSAGRLRKRTAREDVIHAVHVMRDQTELALQDFTDMAVHKSPHPLTLSRLRKLLSSYGPGININQRSAIGGTFLVDTCRARHISESVILTCVKELISNYKASPNICATELRIHKTYTLPPLVIAAARGLSTVVKYLISDEVGASISQEGYSRFRLFSNPRKSISGLYTPLQFAQKMQEAELANGASADDLKSIEKCIQLLSQQNEIKANKV